jgi:hypothetical protein
MGSSARQAFQIAESVQCILKGHGATRRVDLQSVAMCVQFFWGAATFSAPDHFDLKIQGNRNFPHRSELIEIFSIMPFAYPRG